MGFLQGEGGQAMGDILGELGPLFGGGGTSEEMYRNKTRSSGQNFLQQGGGVKNAQEIAKGERANFFNTLFGTSGTFSPEVRAARAGRGPGGGLGVFHDQNEWMEANPVDYEKEGPGIMERLLQTGIGIGSKMLSPPGAGG